MTKKTTKKPNNDTFKGEKLKKSNDPKPIKKGKNANERILEGGKNPKSKPIAGKNPKIAPNGRTLETKDKFLPSGKKGKSQNPKDSRRVVVIDSNPDAEYAVVRLTTRNQSNTSELKSYGKRMKSKNVTYFKHFVEIEDFEGKPITIDSARFKENPKAFDLSKEELNKVQTVVRGHSKQAAQNKERIKKLKSRERDR